MRCCAPPRLLFSMHFFDFLQGCQMRCREAGVGSSTRLGRYLQSLVTAALVPLTAALPRAHPHASSADPPLPKEGYDPPSSAAAAAAAAAADWLTGDRAPTRHLLPAALLLQAAALSRLTADLTAALGDSTTRQVTCHQTVTCHSDMLHVHGALESDVHGWTKHVHESVHVLARVCDRCHSCQHLHVLFFDFFDFDC